MSMTELLTQMRDLAAGVVSEAQRSTVHVPIDDLAAEIAAMQQVIASVTAAQTLRIAQFAARDEQRGEEGTIVEIDRGVGHIAEFASDTLAPMLAMSFGPAAKRVHTAAKLSADLPRTLRALADAQLDPFRAQLVADELFLASRDTCLAVEELIHPEVCGDTPAQVRRRVRRALATVDPASVAQRAARARLERFVTTRAGHVPGVTEWWAQLPAEDSARCWTAIDALAHRRRQDDPRLSLDQCRADALVDLVLGNATVETSLTLVVPVEALPATAPQPAAEPVSPSSTDALREVTGVTVPGIGTIPASSLQSILGTFDTTATRMLVDGRTGVTLETSATTYRPPARIARHVRLRDGTCRFPGCGIRAERCELDHLLPWPAGSTTVSNLLCLCKHHHRLKHRTRWRVRPGPAGDYVWTDPFGQEWTVRPPDQRQLTAA